MNADLSRLSGLLRRLVACDSINPSLVSGARGEGEIAAVLAAECRAAGLDVRLDEVAAGRANVVARVRGARSGRRLLLNGHMDTVGVAGMRAPFAATVDGGRLYGRGAYDMKGSLAAMVEAGRCLAAGSLPAGEVILAFVVDEEHASLGTADLLRREPHPLADGAVVTEPTALEVCIAHKGFVWARITVEGRAAHGSRHDEGDDAILRMGHILTAIARLEGEIFPRRVHPLLGRASIHASIISGGSGLSTYPDRCVLDVERRTLPGEHDEQVLAELEGAIDAARRASPGLRAAVQVLLGRPPLEVAPGEPVVRVLRDSIRAARGADPRLVGESPWFDAALLGQAGIPTVMFGPSGAGAHAAEEWVDLSSVAACADVLVELARRFCDGPP